MDINISTHMKIIEINTTIMEIRIYLFLISQIKIHFRGRDG
jgi:hypothetical protein